MTSGASDTGSEEQVTVGQDTGLLLKPSRAQPDGSSRGILLLHDLLGLTADIRRIGQRFTRHGYVVLVPSYFGSGPQVSCVVRAVTALRRGSGRPFDRLRQAHDHLAGLPEVDPRRVGVVGFCIGGGFAVLWAARSEASAVATFYGDVPKDAQALRGIPSCVAGYGGRDRIFAPHAQRLREHLDGLGLEHDIKVYPQAGHAYLNQHEGLMPRLAGWSPTAARYEETAAEDSWRRMLAFFDEHL